jgi:hypothetical protein
MNLILVVVLPKGLKFSLKVVCMPKKDVIQVCTPNRSNQSFNEGMLCRSVLDAFNLHYLIRPEFSRHFPGSQNIPVHKPSALPGYFFTIKSVGYTQAVSVYLAIQEASKKWTMPIRNWKDALNRFVILNENRMAEFI